MDELVTLKWADNYAKQNYKAGKQAGLKEVVEWIEQYEQSSCKGVFSMPVDVWQAKLKEWDLAPEVKEQR